MNRFQLNFKRNVGPTSESIRKCAPKTLDEWREYYFVNVKPIISGIQLPEIFKEYTLQKKTHQKFTEVFGGKVFYLFSAKVGDKKEIQNKEVIQEIKAEIKRFE